MIKILIAFIGMLIPIAYTIKIYLASKKNQKLIRTIPSPITHEIERRPIINKPHKIKDNEDDTR